MNRRNRLPTRAWTTVAACGAALLSASGAAAQTVIDFESLPGGAPSVHGTPITDQFADPADGGVIFSIDGADPSNPNDALFLGDYGGTRDGWQFGGQPDQLASGYDFGAFFLAHPDSGPGASTIRDVLIDYVNPVGQLGFYLMDLDFTEAWEVTIYDAAANVLQAAIYDASAGGDGLPTHVVFDQTGSTPISRVRLRFVGTATGGIGFGFDDFTPAAIPEPASATLLLAGLLLTARRALRR